MKSADPTPGPWRPWRALQIPVTAQPFQRLVPLGWRGELLVICAGMLLSFLVAGFCYPYWRIADMDFWVVYNAFLLNVPLPQEYFDHPGYLTILLLSYWLRALHALGVVHVVSLSAVPPVADASAFAQAWTAATRAGRVLSLAYAMGFVLAFAYLLRAFVRDWRIAAFGAFLLAFSGGMAMEMRIMRTELLAAAFFFCALLMLLIVAQRGGRWWRPVVVGCAGLLITLAMLNKIPFLFLIGTLPLVLLPFGARQAEPGFWHVPRRAIPAFGGILAVTALAAWLAKDILLTGFFGHGTTSVTMPTLRFGATYYWPALALWIALGMIAFAMLWRVTAVETLAAMSAAVAGCMIGLLALDIRYHPNDVLVVFHPRIHARLGFGVGAAARGRLCRAGGVSGRGRRRRDRAAHFRAGVVAAPDHFPRVVRRRRGRHRHPPRRIAAGAASRGANAGGLGHRHLEHGAQAQAGILPAHRSARHHRRRTADRQADRPATPPLDLSGRRRVDRRACAGEPSRAGEAHLQHRRAGSAMRPLRQRQAGRTLRVLPAAVTVLAQAGWPCITRKQIQL
jgi:hypothetical protein